MSLETVRAITYTLLVCLVILVITLIIWGLSGQPFLVSFVIAGATYGVYLFGGNYLLEWWRNRG